MKSEAVVVWSVESCAFQQQLLKKGRRDTRL